LDLHRWNPIPCINRDFEKITADGVKTRNWLLGQEKEACGRENSNGTLEHFFFFADALQDALRGVSVVSSYLTHDLR
jgi:hypothetical protein